MQGKIVVDARRRSRHAAMMMRNAKALPTRHRDLQTMALDMARTGGQSVPELHDGGCDNQR